VDEFVSIKRYGKHPGKPDAIVESQFGDFVLYRDHAPVVVDLDSARKLLERMAHNVYPALIKEVNEFLLAQKSGGKV
jgi:hypothetical protein